MLQAEKRLSQKALVQPPGFSLEEVFSKQKKAVSVNWLAELLERELGSRRANSIAKRIKLAGFPEVTSLESFDWDFNEKISRANIGGSLHIARS
jgi:DNA replication protein DnaC